MKSPVVFTALCGLTLILSPIEAGSKSACRQKCVQSCSNGTNCGRRVQWYRAKDGTLREMLPYWTALSRAEDADDMEIKLNETETALAASQRAAEEAQAAAAAREAELQAQLAEARQALEAARNDAVAQRDRADKAEAAHKQAVEQVATLREEKEKSDVQVSTLRSDLAAAEEQLKAANAKSDDLQTKLDAANAAAAESANALKAAREEVERLKQDAAATRKPEVENDGDNADDGTGNADDGNDKAAGGAAGETASESV